MVFTSLLLHHIRSKRINDVFHKTTEHVQISSFLKAVDKQIAIHSAPTAPTIYNPNIKLDRASSISDNITDLVTNTTEATMTSNIVSALMENDDVDKSAHRLALTVLISIFLFISLVISIGVFVLCKKKNSVFMLQKCEQDSELEMDDINTEVETSDSEYEQIESSQCISKVKAETYPCLSKYVNEKNTETDDTWTKICPRRNAKNRYRGSPSATPLLQNSETGTHHTDMESILHSKRHSDSQLLPHRYAQKITSCEPKKTQTGCQPTSKMINCEPTEMQTGCKSEWFSASKQTSSRPIDIQTAAQLSKRTILTDNTFVTSLSSSKAKHTFPKEIDKSDNQSTIKHTHSKSKPLKISTGSADKGLKHNPNTSGTSNTRVTVPEISVKARKKSSLSNHYVDGQATQMDSFTLDNVSSFTDDEAIHLRGRLEML